MPEISQINREHTFRKLTKTETYENISKLRNVPKLFFFVKISYFRRLKFLFDMPFVFMQNSGNNLIYSYVFTKIQQAKILARKLALIVVKGLIYRRRFNIHTILMYLKIICRLFSSLIDYNHTIILANNSENSPITIIFTFITIIKLKSSSLISSNYTKKSRVLYPCSLHILIVQYFVWITLMNLYLTYFQRNDNFDLTCLLI